MAERDAVVRSNGIDLATRVDGEEGRPWLVLSNGLATTLQSWDAQVAALTRTHRVLRYDTRGHGRSAAPRGTTSLADLSADLLGLMDHFGMARADLLGLSMGGMTVLGMAIAHGARVRRIVCCDARADAPPALRGGLGHADRGRPAGRNGSASRAARWSAGSRHRSGPGTRPPSRPRPPWSERPDPDGYIACAGALKRARLSAAPPRDPGAERSSSAVPQDQAAPPAAMRDMAEATPGSTYAEIEPGAHLCNIENPDRFNAVVGAWLATTASSA